MYYTAVYRTNDITSLKIRVQLKEVRSVTGLTYRTEILSSEEDILKNDVNAEDQVVEQTFTWNEKFFSKNELKRFATQDNCKTEAQKKYHELIKNGNVQDSVIFTYVEGDNYVSKRESDLNKTIVENDLCRDMRRIRVGPGKLNDTNKPGSINYLNKFKIHKQFCCETPSIMYIVADFHEDNTDDNQHDYVLVKLTWNETKGVLTVYPDFSIGSDLRPYVIEVNSKTYHYWIEDVSNHGEQFDPAQLTLPSSSKQRSEDNKMKNNPPNGDFQIPVPNEFVVYIYGEIEMVEDFEYDNIYVRYCIGANDLWKFPSQESNINCREAMPSGVTHCARTRGNIANFGFPFQIEMSRDISNGDFHNTHNAPKIYFEVISTDSWNRYRTEGYTYVTVPVHQPGSHSYKLQCFDMLRNDWTEEMRRYFVGGTNILQDMSWLGVIDGHQDQVMNKCSISTRSTGCLSVNLNIICQYQNENLKENYAQESPVNGQSLKVNAMSLIQTVEQVLHAFKKARQHMLQAKTQLLIDE